MSCFMLRIFKPRAQSQLNLDDSQVVDKLDIGLVAAVKLDLFFIHCLLLDLQGLDFYANVDLDLDLIIIDVRA